MVQTEQTETMRDLQNQVKELLQENGNLTLKESKDVKTTTEKIFRFPNQSPVVWGDFGIQKAFFLENFEETIIKKFELKEENGIIIVPTH